MVNNVNNIEFLKEKAKWIRRNTLEKVILTKGKGHVGSVYSCTELLIALYYGGILRFDPKNPKWKDRDRFILGKGHVCFALYSILSDLGFFDKSLLEEYGKEGGKLSVQCNISTPGIEYNTGSLGNAIGIASGIALSAKINNESYKTIALVGDGECQEGSIWESLIFASQNKLNNLLVIVDRNRLGVTDYIDDDDLIGKLENRVSSCGWTCLVINGHSFEEIFNAFKISEQITPYMIIADTIKGKGVSFMENDKKWHNSSLTEEEIKIAREELK